MSYIGSSATPLPVAFSGVRTQSFNGTGSQTAFTLSRAVSAVTDIEVVVNNVQQSPYDSSYNISGATLTFSEAPSSGTNNIYVIFRDQPVGSLTDPTSVKKTGDTMTGGLKIDGPMASITPTSKGVYLGYDPAYPNNVGIDVATGTGGIGWLDFTDGSGTDFKGRVAYNNATNVMEFGTNGGAKVFIDSVGRVTMPYQPAFRAGSTSPDGDITYATNSKITHVSYASLNRGNHYDGSNQWFTAPVSGVYFFTAHGWINTGSKASFKITINGGTPSGGNGDSCTTNDDTTTGQRHISFSLLVAMSAGDKAELFTRNVGMTVYKGHSWWQGFLVS